MTIIKIKREVFTIEMITTATVEKMIIATIEIIITATTIMGITTIDMAKTKATAILKSVMATGAADQVIMVGARFTSMDQTATAGGAVNTSSASARPMYSQIILGHMNVSRF